MAVTSQQDMPERGVVRIVATLTAQNDVLNFQMPRLSAMSIQGEGISAGDIELHGSNDGTNFYALPTAVALAADGIKSVATADLGFLHYRITLITASETVVVTVVGMAQR